MLSNLLNHNNPQSLVNRMRTRRLVPLMEIIEETFRRKGKVEILDIGGYRVYWNLLSLEFLERNNVFVTIVNLKDSGTPMREERFRYAVGDGCSLDAFPDKSFDIVHANSVIEHVGGWDRMVLFSREISRLADQYFVQTPNYWFPFEPHYETVFIHWLPKPVQVKLLMKFSFGYMGRKVNLDSAMRTAESIHMLTRRMFCELFKNSELVVERMFFLPKSFVAIKRATTSRV